MGHILVIIVDFAKNALILAILEATCSHVSCNGELRRNIRMQYAWIVKIVFKENKIPDDHVHPFVTVRVTHRADGRSLPISTTSYELNILWRSYFNILSFAC